MLCKFEKKKIWFKTVFIGFLYIQFTSFKEKKSITPLLQFFKHNQECLSPICCRHMA